MTKRKLSFFSLFDNRKYPLTERETFIVEERNSYQLWLFYVYRGLILVKNLVVFRHGHTEDNGGDILETVDPFFSLWSLAAHVEQLEVEVFEWEVNLDNARGLDPGPQDILLSGLVVLRSQAVQIVKETEKKKFWYFLIERIYVYSSLLWSLDDYVLVIVWRSQALSWWKVISLERIQDKSLELLLDLWRWFEKVIKRKV